MGGAAGAAGVGGEPRSRGTRERCPGRGGAFLAPRALGAPPQKPTQTTPAPRYAVISPHARACHPPHCRCTTCVWGEVSGRSPAPAGATERPPAPFPSASFPPGETTKCWRSRSSAPRRSTSAAASGHTFLPSTPGCVPWRGRVSAAAAPPDVPPRVAPPPSSLTPPARPATHHPRPPHPGSQAEAEAMEDAVSTFQSMRTTVAAIQTANAGAYTALRK
jgi:hypothetical protein